MNAQHQNRLIVTERWREMVNVKISKNQQVKVGSPEDIYSIMYKILQRESRLGRTKEHFWVMGLAADNEIGYIELVSLGSVSSAVITPLEIFNLAVAKKSPRIILIHNHPSGTLKPSSADKTVTQQIIKAGKILTIDVLDHLIISENGYYSFAQHHQL